MLVTALAIAAVVLVLAALAGRALLRDPHADVARFHHARELTSTWSETYQGVAEPEQPEAHADKPELQHSVHLCDAA